jgi:hypothetical protein
MFIVLAVAWACALGPGIGRSLAQRGLTFRGSGRSRRTGGGLGASAFGAVGLMGSVAGLRRRRRRAAPVRPTVRLSPAARRQRKRRRELLAGLSSVAFGSLLLGLVPGLRMLLALSAFSSVLLVLYVVALVRVKQAVPSDAMSVAHRPAYEYAYNRASGD